MGSSVYFTQFTLHLPPVREYAEVEMVVLSPQCVSIFLGISWSREFANAINEYGSVGISR
jgi:hypothetical protein